MVPLLEEGDNMWKEKRKDGVTLKVLRLEAPNLSSYQILTASSIDSTDPTC